MIEEERAVESRWGFLPGAAALIVLVFLLWSLRGSLTPAVLFLALAALSTALPRTPARTTLLTVTGVLTLLWLLGSTGTLLAPFIVALGLAYVLDPLVDRLEARGMGRTLAILLLALPVVGLAVVAVVVGLPALGGQVGEFIREDVPVLIERVTLWLDGLEGRLQGIPLVGEALRARLESLDSGTVVAFLEERQTMLVERIWGGVLGVGRGVGSVLTVVGYVVLAPVLTFYLLRDWDRLTHQLGELVPVGRRDAVLGLAREYDGLLARYLRGQVTVALLIGVLTAVGLWITGFPYAFLLGTVVAVFSVVPYLGLVLSLIPAVIVALVSGSVAISLLKLAVVFGIAQGLEGAVISPRIVGESVGLHPVWVVLALTVGGFFFGFVGLLLAVPAAVGVKLLATRGVERWKSSEVYLREG